MSSSAAPVEGFKAFEHARPEMLVLQIPKMVSYYNPRSIVSECRESNEVHTRKAFDEVSIFLYRRSGEPLIVVSSFEGGFLANA
jgi:hypothetical protein